MSTASSDGLKSADHPSMTLPSIAVIGVILANAYIIWFLLIDFPIRCSRLAQETGGAQACSMEGGSLIIATISALMILGGIFYLARRSFPQDT